MTSSPWIDWRPMSEFFGYPSRPWEHSSKYLFYGPYSAGSASYIYIGTCMSDDDGDYRFFDHDWDVATPTHFAALVEPWSDEND